MDEVKIFYRRSLLADNGIFDIVCEDNGFHRIYLSGIIRILSSCVLVCGSIYMLLALLGKMPFTGRLIYGLGVDSVAEPIETLILFILIGLKLHHPKPTKAQQQN